MNLTIIEQLKNPYNKRLLEEFIEFLFDRFNIDKSKEINIVITGNIQIKELNKKFRNKDIATDILSFYGYDGNVLGDIVVSYEAIKEESDMREGKSEVEYFLFIISHGFLHLLGYTHETMEKFDEMIKIQNDLVDEFFENRKGDNGENSC